MGDKESSFTDSSDRSSESSSNDTGRSNPESYDLYGLNGQTVEDVLATMKPQLDLNTAKVLTVSLEKLKALRDRFQPSNEEEFDDIVEHMSRAVATVGLPLRLLPYIIAVAATSRIKKKACQIWVLDPNQSWQSFRDRLAVKLFPHDRQLTLLIKSLEESREICEDANSMIARFEEHLERLTLLCKRWKQVFPFTQKRLKELLAGHLVEDLRKKVLSGKWKRMDFQSFVEKILREEEGILDEKALMEPPKVKPLFDDLPSIQKARGRKIMILHEPTTPDSESGWESHGESGRSEDDGIHVRAIRTKPPPPQMPPPNFGYVHQGIQYKPPRVKRCFNCDSEHHLATQCEAEKVTCTKCNRLGHLDKYCYRYPSNRIKLTEVKNSTGDVVKLKVDASATHNQRVDETMQMLNKQVLLKREKEAARKRRQPIHRDIKRQEKMLNDKMNLDTDDDDVPDTSASKIIPDAKTSKRSRSKSPDNPEGDPKIAAVNDPSRTSGTGSSALLDVIIPGSGALPTLTAKAILDGGAHISALSDTVVSKLSLQDYGLDYEVFSTPRRVNVYGGGGIEVLGVLSLPLKLGNRTIVERIWVTNTKDPTFVLGMPFIMGMKMEQRYHDSQVIVDGQSIPIEFSSAPLSRISFDVPG